MKLADISYQIHTLMYILENKQNFISAWNSFSLQNWESQPESAAKKQNKTNKKICEVKKLNPEQFCSSWLQTGLIGLFAWMLPHLIKAISRWRPRKSWPCQTQTFSPLSNTMLSEAAFKTRYAKKKNFRQSRLCYFNDQFQELLYDS